MMSRARRRQHTQIRDAVRAYVATSVHLVSGEERSDVTAMPHVLTMLRTWLERNVGGDDWRRWPEDEIQRELGIAMRDAGAVWDPDAMAGTGAFRGVECW